MIKVKKSQLSLWLSCVARGCEGAEGRGGAGFQNIFQFFMSICIHQSRVARVSECASVFGGVCVGCERKTIIFFVVEVDTHNNTHTHT